MQHMKRLEGFLEAVQTYSKVLDVFVNVNDMVAFIWVCRDNPQLLGPVPPRDSNSR